jgi:hypothetical protein
MEVLHIEATEDSPEIILDQEKDVFEISGRSLPEDVNTFYQPAIAWIEEYSKNPNRRTIFKFKFLYFNTASSKIILDILTIFEEMIEDKHDVLIRWYYAETDEDMLDAGEEYSEMVEVPFEFIAIKHIL